MDKMLAPDGRKWWSPFNHSIRRFSPQLCKEASHPDLLGWSRCCPTSCLTRSSSLPIFHTKGLQKLLVYLSFLKAMLSLFNNTKTKLPCFTQFSNIKMGGGGEGLCLLSGGNEGFRGGTNFELHGEGTPGLSFLCVCMIKGQHTRIKGHYSWIKGQLFVSTFDHWIKWHLILGQHLIKWHLIPGHLCPLIEPKLGGSKGS